MLHPTPQVIEVARIFRLPRKVNEVNAPKGNHKIVIVLSDPYEKKWHTIQTVFLRLHKIAILLLWKTTDVSKEHVSIYADKQAVLTTCFMLVSCLAYSSSLNM
jgi:hypothetical protein